MNVLVDDSLLAGFEGEIAWLANGSFQGQVDGRLGFVADQALLYAFIGLGANSVTNAYVPVGVGVEFAVADNLSLKAEYQTLRQEQRQMATYLLLSTLTDEGRKTLKERPERLQEVNKEIETMGGRVVAQYATLGLYDFVNVVEAASNEVIARISVELGARGTVSITTLPAMSVQTLTDMLRSSSSG